MSHEVVGQDVKLTVWNENQWIFTYTPFKYLYDFDAIITNSEFLSIYKV
jgi:hypothetical protein